MIINHHISINLIMQLSFYKFNYAASASPKSGYRISKPGESESPPSPTTTTSSTTSTGNSWLRSIENHHFLTNPQNSSQLPNNCADVSTSSGGNSRLDTRPVLKPSKLCALDLSSSAHDIRAGDCKSFRPISPPLTTSTTHHPTWQFRPASSKTLPTRLNGLALSESNYADADFASKPLPNGLKWRGRKEFIPPSVLRKNRFLNGLHSSPLNGIHPHTKDKDLRMSAFRQRSTSKDAHSNDGSRRRFCRMCGFCLKFALFLSLAFNILLILLYFYRSPTTQQNF